MQGSSIDTMLGFAADNYWQIFIRRLSAVNSS